jgi:hypothetical protein
MMNFKFLMPLGLTALTLANTGCNSEMAPVPTAVLRRTMHFSDTGVDSVSGYAINYDPARDGLNPQFEQLFVGPVTLEGSLQDTVRQQILEMVSIKDNFLADDDTIYWARPGQIDTLVGNIGGIDASLFSHALKGRADGFSCAEEGDTLYIFRSQNARENAVIPSPYPAVPQKKSEEPVIRGGTSAMSPAG